MHRRMALGTMVLVTLGLIFVRLARCTMVASRQHEEHEANRVTKHPWPSAPRGFCNILGIHVCFNKVNNGPTYIIISE